MYENGQERKKKIIMKTYKHLWEDLISDENIVEAVHNASHGSVRGKRREILKQINENVINSIPDIRFSIENYTPDVHVKKKIVEGGKERTIIIPSIKEHIVQHCVMLILKPIFIRSMYEHSYASIPDRGCHNGAYYMMKWIEQGGTHVKYCGKFDIRKFFENIDQEVLINKLERIIDDDRFMEILKQIIHTTDTGLPIGFYTSQWFANFYLQSFDHYVKEDLRVKYYMRYMDDMVIFGSNKKELHMIKDLMLNYLQENLHVWFKDNWQIFRFDTMDHQGCFLDFMGFKFYRDHMTMRKSIARKAMRLARKLSKKNIITVDDARRMLSYYGWIKHTDSYTFMKNHINPYINFDDLKKIISEHDKRRNTYVEKDTKLCTATSC